MAKLTKSQAFAKATIYYDNDEREWKIEEVGKDNVQVFSLIEDVLMQWKDVDGVSITIKKDMDYTPRESA
ncbi:MAG: hypothetical protein J6S14_20850 [Clostridia bacterium]|nr:hypothetical protein [Clostridia bacterium]